jgi:peptidoglycan/LPS O-acetylase OafA/YrhL
MPDAERELRALANMLDFGCFVVIFLLHAMVLLSLASVVRSGWLGATGLLVVALPLVLWLCALIGLRKYLERPRQRFRVRWRWDTHERKQEPAQDGPKAA